MNTYHIKVVYCKAQTTDDLDIECADKMLQGYIPLNGSTFGKDPDIQLDIFYQTMVKELILDENITIVSVKNITAKTSVELETLVNIHLDNNTARCMGSAYIANGKWIQTISNLKSHMSNITKRSL